MKTVLQKLLWTSILVSAIGAINVFGAACCGGGASSPALILGDQSSQFSSSYSLANTYVENVDKAGNWYKSDKHKNIEILNLAFSKVFKDRWQWGVLVPVVSKTYNSQNYSGLGDPKINLAYEYITDWDYHPYRPKAVAYISLLAPGGKTKYDSNVGGIDSFGQAFWGLALGTVFSKSLINFDWSASLELRKAFAKKVSSESLDATASPGFGGSLGLSGGYNWEKIRWGFSLDWIYEDPVELTSQGSTSSTFYERYAVASSLLSYKVNDLWLIGLAYTDQGLFGSPVNTSLSRSFLISAKRNWLR